MDMRLLDANFFKAYNVDLSVDYRKEIISAIDLIVSTRLDLVIKYKYVEAKVRGYKTDFFKNLYKEHIGYMTAGSFSKDGNASKNMVDDYLQAFDNLIESIQANGFDPDLSVIPVGADNTILDGAHRVAVCAFFGLKVSIVRFPEINVANDYRFFKRAGMDDDTLDYLMIEYCRLRKNTFIALLWPRAVAFNKNADNLLREHVSISYKRELSINKDALRNLIIQIYATNDWIGGYDHHFYGACPQINGCYDSINQMIVYVVEAPDFETVKECKQHVRECYGVGNYAMHSSDNKRETLQIANILFNRNSRSLLQKGNPDSYIPVMERLEYFKKNVTDHKFSLDDFFIDDGLVLSLYGLRMSHDLNYISGHVMNCGREDISCHNEHLKYWGVDLDELIYNPDYYLYFNECKISSLHAIKKYKINRGDKKDLKDVNLIEEIERGEGLRLVIKRIKAKCSCYHRNFLYYFLNYIVKISRRIGCYGFLRKVFHKNFREK